MSMSKLLKENVIIVDPITDSKIIYKLENYMITKTVIQNDFKN